MDKRLRLCFTLSIPERAYKLGSWGLRVGLAHQIAAEFEDLSRTQCTMPRQITVSERKPDAACGSFG